jgi:outer membrane cobalamin receptor
MLQSTNEAIIGATVTVVGTDLETVTGPLGDFAIMGAPLGAQWVRVAASGLPAVREMVEITEDGIVFMQFRMPEDVSAVLDEVVVEVISPDASTDQAQTALDLLAIKIPSLVRGTSGFVGTNTGSIQLRGINSISQSGEPLVVIDDLASAGDRPALEILAEIPAGDVETIEILRGPAAAVRYPYASNGVIRIKTRRR